MKNELVVVIFFSSSYEYVSLKDSTGRIVVLGRGTFKHFSVFSEEMEKNKEKQAAA